jgi:hypothetical protein
MLNGALLLLDAVKTAGRFYHLTYVHYISIYTTHGGMSWYVAGRVKYLLGKKKKKKKQVRRRVHFIPLDYCCVLLAAGWEP